MRLPRSLRSRLLLANLVVVGVALGTVLIAVNLVGPGYFAEAMGHRPGDAAGERMDAATLAAYGEAIRTALLAALVVAVVVAVVVAIAISTRIAGPVTRLASAARRVAVSFNGMASSLEATERRRLRLVGDVAHELRTPLATLDGYLEGLQDGVVAAAPTTWELLRRETARLTRLVGDLQDLWRAEARDLPLRMTPINVAAVARDAVDRARPAAAARTIALELELSGSPAAALADRDRVAQILDNFLSNALRYAPEGSRIVVGATQAGPFVRLSVRDAGAGLTEEQRTQVFERFYRIDPSRSRALGGAGIGLAIVRALAEAMDGRVWAESDGPGTGSTFSVELPAA